MGDPKKRPYNVCKVQSLWKLLYSILQYSSRSCVLRAVVQEDIIRCSFQHITYRPFGQQSWSLSQTMTMTSPRRRGDSRFDFKSWPIHAPPFPRGRGVETFSSPKPASFGYFGVYLFRRDSVRRFASLPSILLFLLLFLLLLLLFFLFLSFGRWPRTFTPDANRPTEP